MIYSEYDFIEKDLVDQKFLSKTNFKSGITSFKRVHLHSCRDRINPWVYFNNNGHKIKTMDANIRKVIFFLYKP